MQTASASFILHPTSFILHPAYCIIIIHTSSRILHSAYCILHSASCILHHASCILQPASRTMRPSSASCILQPVSSLASCNIPTGHPASLDLSCCFLHFGFIPSFSLHVLFHAFCYLFTRFSHRVQCGNDHFRAYIPS